MEEDKEIGTKRKEILQVVVLTRRSRRILVAEQVLNIKNHDIENLGHEQSRQFPSGIFLSSGDI